MTVKQLLSSDILPHLRKNGVERLAVLFSPNSRAVLHLGVTPAHVEFFGGNDREKIIIWKASQEGTTKTAGCLEALLRRI